MLELSLWIVGVAMGATGGWVLRARQHQKACYDCFVRRIDHRVAELEAPPLRQLEWLEEGLVARQ